PHSDTNADGQVYETAKVALATLLDRRTVTIVAYDHAVDVVVTGFNAFSGNSASAPADEVQRHLRSPAFIEALDTAREKVREELQVDRSATITVAGVSLGVSVAYVLWLIRGGVLVSSYLSAMPAWRLLDPLPVLSRIEDEDEEQDDDGGDVLDANIRRPGDALRGFN
ncbi:MAG: hypothetical protein H7255_06685, partial [Ramlibacter sp.]|nr:hypothetical protein [Ramlibacter sp.]